MWEFHIYLRSFPQVQAFVRLTSEQNFDVVVGNDHQKINGKDLMGLSTLDYSRPLWVNMYCPEEDYLRFKQAAESFLA